MTLCIAAACQYRNMPRIVTCTDWRVTTGYGSANNTDKMRWIKKPNWVALTAGNKTMADALVRSCRTAVASETLTEDTILPILERVARKLLVARKDAYVFATLGVTYADFLNRTCTQFPESVVTATFSEIRKMRIDASLIVAGFVPKGKSVKPLICKIDRNGGVSISEHFECSGEGQVVASPTLLRREYNSSVSLMDAAYRLYEAKKLSEVYTSVSEDTSVDILYPDGKLEQFSDSGHDKLISMFKTFGPKKNIKFPKLAKKYFDSLEFNSLR